MADDSPKKKPREPAPPLFPMKKTVELIRYNGPMDIDGVYDLVKSWAADNDFENFEEDTYKWRNDELEITWLAWKETDIHVRETVTFTTHIFGIHKTDVIKNGKKKSMQSGRGEFTFGFKVEIDWDGIFEGSSFWVKVKKFMNNKLFLMKYLIDYVLPLKNNVMGLVTEVKKFLDMEAT